MIVPIAALSNPGTDAELGFDFGGFVGRFKLAGIFVKASVVGQRRRAKRPVCPLFSGVRINGV